MQSQLEEQHPPSKTKMKTEQKPLTLHQIKTDITNIGKICLGSGVKMQFGKPVKLPLIRRKTNYLEATIEECYSSRTSNQNSSQIDLRGELREPNRDVREERSNSFLGRMLLEKENFRVAGKERSLEAGNNAVVGGNEVAMVEEADLIEDIGNNTRRKALPKILRYKYFRESERLQRIRSERNVLKVQTNQTLNKYRLGNLLGKGTYATVRMAKSQTGDLFAIKTYQKARLNDPQKLQNVKRQVQILSRICHPNIIKFHQVIQTTLSINIITQLAQPTSLLTHLKTTLTNKLPQDQARPLLRQLLQTLQYLHSKNICHRDLKLQNILLTKQKKIKLIDFGFSIQSNSKLNSFCGTPSYIAPEILAKKGYYGKPADIWSCGVVVYKVLCGGYPFKGLNERTLYSKISKGVFRFAGDISVAGQLMISRMLAAEPGARPLVEEVLEDPWFRVGGGGGV